MTSERVPRHARWPGRRGVARVAVPLVVAVALFGVSSAAALVVRLQSNLDTQDIASLVGPAPRSSSAAGPQVPDDPGAGRATNLLVLGSDQRDGDNLEAGGAADTMASDTAIVVHLAADRGRVELVSIPRDSLVDIPACAAGDGTQTQPQPHAIFNKAFRIGWEAGGTLAAAAACTTRTVQAATGLTIDHVVVVDFAGFQAMVDAIGGVDICLPEPAHDEKTGLDLPAGRRTLDGPTALKFARNRYGVGDGGDLGRIGNQQRLVAAIANQVLSADVLANPARLTGFLDAATASLTVDEGLDIAAMAGLAYGLRSVRAADITLLTIPTADAPDQRYRLVWTPQAADVWANLAADRPIVRPDGTLSPSPGAEAPTTEPPAPPGAPSGAPPGPTSPPSPSAPVPGEQPFTPADVPAACG